jgi:SNF2 family DNA or RNA helicase
MEYLAEHFEIPDIPTISEPHPAEFERWKRRLWEVVERFDDGKRFNRHFLEAFQVEDTAKLLMKSGGLLSWEQGLGKTIAALLYAKASGARNVLIVSPQDIVRQWRQTGEEKFLTDLHPIAGVRDAIRVRQQLRAGETAGYYITWYEALSQAGKIEEMSAVQWQGKEDEKGRVVYHPYTTSPYARDGKSIPLDCCPRCGMTQSKDKQVLDQAMHDTIARHGRATTEYLLRNRPDSDGRKQEVRWLLARAPGQNEPRLVQATCTRCGYTHWSRRLKPAAYWLRDLFDLVVVDEGTKIKNMDSQTSQAIQGIRAPHRLLLTGTPIKNYIQDAFALMWWAMGDNSARFPFSHTGGQTKFESEFSVVQYVIDVKRNNKKLSRKVLPQVSNLIAFWRLANAGCIRRTKENSGVTFVPARWHDLRAPFGARQAAAYELWLQHFADWFIEKHPKHPISQHENLIRRSAGILGQFAKLQFMCTLPEAEPDHWATNNGYPVSNFTPKNVAVIRKAMELADQGRKVVIFSAVKEHSLWMAKILNKVGCPALSIVEEKGDNVITIGPQGRADLVRDFITDGFPVLCASIHAMNLGHNLDCVSAVIVNGLPWDYASFSQAIARVHRITSRDPVDIYVAQVVCSETTDDFRAGASLDQKMRRLIRDKGESSSLALDGELAERNEDSLDIQKFLEELSKQWREPLNTLDEADLQRSLLRREKV